MDELVPRLADVATHWSRVLQAQNTQGDAAVAARHELLVRYHEAVLRYLQLELRDEHAAAARFTMSGGAMIQPRRKPVSALLLLTEFVTIV